MTKMTDYEKVKEESLKTYLQDHPCSMELTQSERSIFDYTFESAYCYGRMVGMEETKANPDKPAYSEQLRAQVAIAVMQGLLSNPDITARYEEVLSDAAHDAVVAANYLLVELDRTLDNGN